MKKADYRNTTESFDDSGSKGFCFCKKCLGIRVFPVYPVDFMGDIGFIPENTAVLTLWLFVFGTAEKVSRNG